MAPVTVFLSHLTIESKLADWLQRHIDNDFIGLVKVFSSSDRLSIPVAQPWLDKVMTGLEQSQMHLVLCSPESINRPWIQFEAGAAWLRKLPVAPLCHSDLTPAQLPVPLSDFQGIQLEDAEGVQALYAALASLLGSTIPKVDFAQYADEVGDFEEQYAQHQKVEKAMGSSTAPESVIREPRVLCVSSKQFLALGFENQIDIVLKAFPSRLQHHRLIESSAVRELLARQQIDVIHIAAYVCPRTGDLYFSDVDLASGTSISAERDVISADELAQLLANAAAQLVVVGSCESLVLAATLIPFVNVIATRDMVSPQMMAKWVEVFYEALIEQPLSNAFRQAVMASGAQMRLYAKSDVRIAMTSPGAR